ncbi:MAG: hypothetical protein Kow00127_15070 [Bacteroidales bacterium]
MVLIRFSLVLAAFLLIYPVTGQQSGYRTVENKAFQPGEVLTYRFYYDAWLTGKVTAGVGSMKIEQAVFEGKEVWHIIAEGQSKGMFNWFFKVRDRFESFIDPGFLAPYYFIRQTREGGYRKDDTYRFNHENRYVVTSTDSMSVPEYTQDFISAVYYARTFRTDTLKPGAVLPVHFFIDDSVYNSAIIYEGIDTVSIETGTYRCLKFRPGMATGEVFADKYPMTLWVTDDLNHIPVLAKSAVIVGSVKAELTSFSGIKNKPEALLEDRRKPE